MRLADIELGEYYAYGRPRLVSRWKKVKALAIEKPTPRHAHRHVKIELEDPDGEKVIHHVESRMIIGPWEPASAYRDAREQHVEAQRQYSQDRLKWLEDAARILGEYLDQGQDPSRLPVVHDVYLQRGTTKLRGSVRLDLALLVQRTGLKLPDIPISPPPFEDEF